MVYRLPAIGELDWGDDVNGSIAAVKATADAAETPTGAQDKANVARDFARLRANHTGSQVASTISDFNAAAITAVGAAQDGTTAANIGSAASATRAAIVVLNERSEINAQDHGVRGDGTGEDVTALSALVTSLRPGSSGVAGAKLVIPSGDYPLNDTLLFSKWSGVVTGSGTGNAGTYSSGAGKATVFRWIGPDTKSMVKLRDYRGVTFEHIRFTGNDATPPLACIESNNVTGDGAGTAEGLKLNDVWMGKWTWSAEGAVGAVKAGVLFSGDNTNNDQFSFRDLTITGCEVGIDLPNSQSIWGASYNLLVANASVAGVRTSASTRGYNWTFDNCIKDVQVNSTAKVKVYGWSSERSSRQLDIPGLGSCIVYGGEWRLQSPMTTSDVFVNAPAMTANAVLKLDGVDIVNALGAPHPKIFVRSTGGGSPSLGKFVMRDCQTTMTLSDFDVACTVSNALEVDISCGNSLYLRRRFLNAQTLSVEGTRINGFLEGVEQTAPSAPSADQGRLFYQDNGAGKTQLCVLFATGAVQVIATQP